MSRRRFGAAAPRLDAEWLKEGLAAGAVAALVSGAPSTVHALLTRRDPLQATVAAGSLLLRDEGRRGRLVLAAVPAHLAISLGWALVLARLLPRERTVAAGAAAGLVIAALDLGLIGRRYPKVRALPLVPQLLDHAAFGAAVGAVLARRRSRRP